MARFIVIDGLDGCGKATQTKLLKERLIAEGKNAISVSFPNYTSNSSALVKMYLNGELGEDISKLNPYMCGAFYAVDRFVQYTTYLKQYFLRDNNTIILSDRYLSANIIHQGSKLTSAEEKHKYIRWCYDFECGLAGLPKEDITLVLAIPPLKSQELMTKRYNGDETKKDVHESNVDYLDKCYYELKDTLEYIETQDDIHWKMVNCLDSVTNSIKSIEEIAEIIYGEVKYLL